MLVPDSFACARWRFKVQPGDVLATLDNTASVALRFNLNEADIGRVQLGTPVEVTTPDLSRSPLQRQGGVVRVAARHRAAHARSEGERRQRRRAAAPRMAGAARRTAGLGRAAAADRAALSQRRRYIARGARCAPRAVRRRAGAADDAARAGGERGVDLRGARRRAAAVTGAARAPVGCRHPQIPAAAALSPRVAPPAQLGWLPDEREAGDPWKARRVRPRLPVPASARGAGA